MLSVIKERVIGREGNIVLVDFSESRRIRRRHAFQARTVCASHAARRRAWSRSPAPALIARATPLPSPAGQSERLTPRPACD